MDMMSKMGCGLLWVRWISKCLSTTTAFVLINGSLTDEIQMKRGLHQGDPLSTFLFLIAVEELHPLIEEAKHKGLLKGIEIGKASMNISYIQ